jgi:hypothetical protein
MGSEMDSHAARLGEYRRLSETEIPLHKSRYLFLLYSSSSNHEYEPTLVFKKLSSLLLSYYGLHLVFLYILICSP